MQIQIAQFYFPVDFIVLETEPVSNPNAQIPLILGRPFLANSNAIIHYRNGQLRLSIGHLTIDLNISNINKRPREFKNDEADMIQMLVDGNLGDTSDSLTMCLDHFTSKFNINEYTSELNDLLDTSYNSQKFDQLMTTEVAIEDPPKLDPNLLPHDLKYAFLDPSKNFPKILASDLIEDQEKQLLKILKENKEELGWVVTNIKE